MTSTYFEVFLISSKVGSNYFMVVVDEVDDDENLLDNAGCFGKA